MDSLPTTVSYKFISNVKLFENSETDLYEFSVGDDTYFIKITTDNLPDVVMVLTNAYNGGELYRELDDNSYQRVVECRKNGNDYGIYLVDEFNNSEKLLSVTEEDATVIDALLIGYRFYWSNFRKN